MCDTFLHPMLDMAGKCPICWYRPTWPIQIVVFIQEEVTDASCQCDVHPMCSSLQSTFQSLPSPALTQP
jgi:hypothetical protein